MKKELIDFFDSSTNHQLIDAGPYIEHNPQDMDPVDYPDYARLCCELITRHNKVDNGVLICGTGIGMCIAANKIKGIRAATVNSTELARLSREHNNANVVCMGSNMLSRPEMTAIVNVFIKTEFSRESRHVRRVDKMMQLEG